MTLDELINQLQELKELHPIAGRFQVVNNDNQPLLTIKKTKTYNCSALPEKIILKFNYKEISPCK